MEIRVESAEAALEKCWELVRRGEADLFRGQVRDWPKLIPSLFRSSREDRGKAGDELANFQEWSRFVPQMASYGGDEVAITAIAQHYGIPTAFLDLTTNPEIAASFAKGNDDPEPFSESVIYCFLEARLRSVAGGRIARIGVENLWRLEAQHGLFFEYGSEEVADSVKAHATKIIFPAARLSEAEEELLYPTRKSALEVAVDQWIYRRQVEELVDRFSASSSHVMMTHRETYAGAFRWRSTPDLDPAWIGYEKAWVFPPVESVSVVGHPFVVQLPRLTARTAMGARKQFAGAVAMAVREARASGRLLRLSASLSKRKRHLEESVSSLINRCWDGLRVLPYSVEELIASITTTATLLVARAEGRRGVDDWPEAWFGDLQLVEVAPVGGHIEAGYVRKSDLIGAFSPAHVGEMTRYMSRKFSENPLFVANYVVENWIIFDFQRLKRLFVETWIPTTVDAYWKEDLNLYGGSLGCMWSLNFNPALLGYITLADFRFESPIAAEKSCDRIVYVLPDMDRSDIEEAFVSCMPAILGGHDPFQVKFHGYGWDPRPLWQIERVVEQAKWIVEVGGISPLAVMPTIMRGEDDEDELREPGLGAFEIWLISKQMMDEVQGRFLGDLKPIVDEFYSELLIANSNIETRALAALDWPGPSVPR